MKAIVRKDRKRKAEDPLKTTTYRLRGRTAAPQRIERYKKDHHITDDTAISEAGMLKKITVSAFVNGNIGLATPSDLSCETPRPLSLSNSPASTPLPELHKPSKYSPPTGYMGFESGRFEIPNTFDHSKAFDSGMPLIPSLKSSSAFLSGLQPYDELSNTILSLDVFPPLVTRAYPNSNADYLARTELKLPQALSTKLQKHELAMNTSESPAGFEQRSLDHFLKFLRDVRQKYTFYHPLPMPVAGPYCEIFCDWLCYKLEDMSRKNRCEDIDRRLTMARLYQYWADICVDEKTVLSTFFAFRTLLCSLFERCSMSEIVGDMEDSHEFALGDRACGCDMCQRLPQVLTVENIVQTFSLCFLSLAHMPPSDPQIWSARFGEIIQAWLRAPDNISTLHKLCHLSMTRATMACHEGDVASMKPYKVDENWIMAVRLFTTHLDPLLWEAWMTESEKKL